ILAAPGSCARPRRVVPPGLVAELSCQKIIFDLQLADLPIQKIDLGVIAGSLRRRTTLEDACRTVQQLLLPVVDLVRVDPEMHRQLGHRPVALDCRQRHLRLESRAVLLPCPLHVLLPRYPRFLGAGLHLIHLSHFRGPPQSSRNAGRNHLGTPSEIKSECWATSSRIRERLPPESASWGHRAGNPNTRTPEDDDFIDRAVKELLAR